MTCVLELRGQRLDLLVVGRDAAAQQPPRRGQALEQVDVGPRARRAQLPGRVRAGRAGADDRDAAHAGAAARSRKNAALTSSMCDHFSGTSPGA